MEINKILSDSTSPPHKRRQLTHPSLRQYIMSRRRPDASELEVAELMAALSTGCMSRISEASPVVPSNHHPPGLGFRHHSCQQPVQQQQQVQQQQVQQQQVQQQRPVQQQQVQQQQPVQQLLLVQQQPLNVTITTPKKGRRATTTKRLAPSPSGQPCANCGVETSTLWRTCEIHNRSSYLCNACGLRYKKGKFCPICYRVYYDVDTNQLHWKQCQNCMNWTHKHCLQQRGTLTNTPYTCLTCRRKNEDQGNVSSRDSSVV